MKIQAQNFINKEENLKVKVALNYLKKLGFTEENLEFETQFSIQLGKKKHKVHGFSDILCSKDDRNLFIIEVKAENIKITQSVIDQGVSYARLVHPVAPFVIVTNGKEKGTFIIDTISKNKINESEIVAKLMESRHCNYKATISLSDVYEALRNFIGYCPENLQAFSCSQTEERMRSLKEEETGSGKKYIPELFLQRDDILESFRKFIDSPSQCFALIGESGVGKTNFMCGLAEYFSGHTIVLFFNAQQLVRSIIDNIKEDFNWVFSSQLEPPEIIRKIEALTERTNSKVCFFFDAIDEASSKDFQLDLDDFVRKVRNFSNIKICVSCKTSEWEKRFLRVKGNPTYLSESLFSLDDNSKTIEAQRNEQYHGEVQRLPGYIVNRFSEREIEILFKKYQQYFNYAGELTPSIKDECKLGFMLRVVSEVYQGKMLPEVIDNIELFHSYLIQKLQKFEKPEIAINYLREIGRILIEQEAEELTTLLSGQIEEVKLREKLSLSVEAEILPGLFTFNILNRTPRGDGTPLIGFYYTRIRDFVIAILSFRLSSLNDTDFKAILPKMLHGAVGQSVISWYANIANSGHKAILTEYQHTRALLFLNEYTRLIERLFPHLQEYFQPHTSGKIGLAMSGISGVFSLQYGFYALRDAHDELIKQVQVDPEPNKREYDSKLSAEFFKLGVMSITRTRSDDFMSIEPRQAAITEVKEQLKELLEEGRLNEQNNMGLAIEKTTHILYHYGKRLRLDIDNSYTGVPRVGGLFPIDCDDILSRIKFFNAFVYYERLEEQRYLQRERIKERRKGNLSFYTINRMALNYEEVYERATLAIQNHEDIPVPNTRGDFPPFLLLSKTIETIKKQYAQVSEPLLPPPDIPRENLGGGGRSITLEELIFAQYSDAQLKKYVESFFALFLQEYKILVDVCFPTLKDKLPFYASLPLHLIAEVYNNQNVSLKYGYGYNDTGDNIIEVEINPQASRLSWINEKITTINSRNLEEIFQVRFTRNPTPLDMRLNTRETDRFCILREWVYQKIKSELEHIEQELQ